MTEHTEKNGQTSTTSELWMCEGVGVHILKFPPDGTFGPIVIFCKDRTGRDAIVFGEPQGKLQVNGAIRYQLARTKITARSQEHWTVGVPYDKKVGEADLRWDNGTERYTLTFINFRPEVDLLPSPLPPAINETLALNHIAE